VIMCVRVKEKVCVCLSACERDSVRVCEREIESVCL